MNNSVTMLDRLKNFIQDVENGDEYNDLELASMNWWYEQKNNSETLIIDCNWQNAKRIQPKEDGK